MDKYFNAVTTEQLLATLSKNLSAARRVSRKKNIEVATEVLGSEHRKNRLSEYESGKLLTPLLTLVNMCIYYNISLDWVCGLSTEIEPDISSYREANIVNSLKNITFDMLSKIAMESRAIIKSTPKAHVDDLIKKVRDVEMMLSNICQHTSFKKSINGANNLIQAVQELGIVCDTLENVEIEAMRRLEVQASNINAHDDAEIGHRMLWEAETLTPLMTVRK